MKKQHYFILTTIIFSIIFAINIYQISNQSKGYYICKVEKISESGEITRVDISPVSSKRYFISEIKVKHQIKYKSDEISISGIGHPRKEKRTLKLGELDEIVREFKVGDTIIFYLKDKRYDKNEYVLEIDGLAVDLTLE